MLANVIGNPPNIKVKGQRVVCGEVDIHVLTPHIAVLALNVYYIHP